MARKHDVKRGDGMVQERVGVDGTTRFDARWYEGNQRRSKTFRSAEAAEDHLRSIGRMKRSGTYNPQSDMTVNDVVTEYLARGKPRWSASTHTGYTAILHNHIEPAIGRKRIAELTPRDVQHMLDGLKSDAGKKLSPSATQHVRAVISGACSEAVRLGIIPANPVSNTRSPSRKRSDFTVWSDAESQRVLRAVASNIELRAMYTIALTTALRPGEIRALMWSAVDLQEGTLTVERTMTRDEHGQVIVGETTKTHERRTIALPAMTVDALKAQRTDQLTRRLATEGWFDTGLVFDRGNGLFLPQQRWHRQHAATCLIANVPHIRLHDLRHTAATAMLRNNVSLKVVSEVLGHRSIKITADTYLHVDLDMMRAATDVLAIGLSQVAN